MITSSVKQRMALLTALGGNTDWNLLSIEEVQLGIRESQRAGREFTLFAKNGFRVQIGDLFRETGELMLAIPALPRPMLAELREKFPWIREENGIERDTSPTEAVTLTLGTILRPDEGRVDDTEYERRIASVLGRMLGYQQAVWCVEHQDEFPTLMALLGKVYIDFPGLVVVAGHGSRYHGSRYVPDLYQDGERWRVGWRWLEEVFRLCERVASGK